MSDTQYFHFTLGPVQSFVVQARRTRDFWAGSFILSWLSGVAMQEVIAQCGDDRRVIEFPVAEDNFLDWLTGKQKVKSPPTQGGIPNRFKARIPAGQAFNPALVEQAVQIAWKALADVVYERDLAKLNVETLELTHNVWERQIKSCWEVVWAMTPDSEDSAILDQSKYWRGYAPPEEAGVKCMMMDGWQELSAVERPSAKTLGGFWATLRKGELIASVEPVEKKNYLRAIASDIRPNEYLCAIAFVKRRFPRYFSEVKTIKTPSGWELRGWDVGTARPSVAYMAAVPWLEQAIQHANESEQTEQQMQVFHRAAFALTEEHGEWDSDIRCIRRAMEAKPRSKEDRKWKALNGEVFFENELENQNKFPREEKQEEVRRTLVALRALQRTTETKAAPFYAVLMMDGDSLGKQLSDSDKQKAIAKGLQVFNEKVPGIVQDHDGFLVYCGGDDVLAVLPINQALGCALAVRECYETAFERCQREFGIKISTSISAAVEFAHIHMPLTKVLGDAHSLLDDVAKERCGRDSLAVRVWKPGGKALEWAMPWNKACNEANGEKYLVIEFLCKHLGDDDPQQQFSNGFFYKIRERLELLNPSSNAKDAAAQSVFKLEQAVKLMAAEYVNSGLFSPLFDKTAKNYKQQQLEHAEAVVGPLLEQCYPVRRILPKRDECSGEQAEEPIFKPLWHSYHADAALLVRFLVHKGVER